MITLTNKLIIIAQNEIEYEFPDHQEDMNIIAKFLGAAISNRNARVVKSNIFNNCLWEFISLKLNKKNGSK